MSGPVEVVKQVSDAAGTDIPNWLKQVLGAAVFLLVGLASAIPHIRKKWAELAGDSSVKHGTLIAATLDTQTPRLTLETLNRIADRLDEDAEERAKQHEIEAKLRPIQEELDQVRENRMIATLERFCDTVDRQSRRH